MKVNSRTAHSISVARKMKEITKEVNPDNKELIEEMFTLGYLHDIGYEFSSDAHANVGGEILKRCGYKYWKEVYYHGKINIEYESDALRILNEADLQVDSKGKNVTVEERLKDVKDRYGETSLQYTEFRQLALYIGLKNNDE